MNCEYCGGNEWLDWHDSKKYCRGCGAVQNMGGSLNNMYFVGEPGPELIVGGVVLPPDLTKDLLSMWNKPRNPDYWKSLVED